ncbi:MAG: hypothetical protein M3Z26_06190 [Bacteroidota bacterium]|nr:hypothetical protein [Bacteroidota bacterium]
MNINRDNYEEYFLMYADNELSQTEKKVVEIFVQENVDLREEFLMIRLTVNAPDEEIRLADKSFLIKDEPSFINENNYEEIFVLYFDDELSISQKIETEKFITANQIYKAEFDLYKKIKLVANENVVFPNKKLLYRKEKAGKVIPLILWRSMAAAVFVGFGLWISISILNNKEVKHGIALKGKTTKPLITTLPKANLKNHDDLKNADPAFGTKDEIVEIVAKDKDLKERQNRIIKESNGNIVIKKDKINGTITEKKTIETKQENNDELLAANIPVKNISVKIEGTKNAISANEVIQHIDKYDESIQPQAHVENTSYAVDNKTNDENYVFYNVKTDEFNKSKVGGFLKKVKRIVERSNPITRLLSGEDKQVVSK